MVFESRKPTHLLRPLLDGEMSRFIGWIGRTHTMRYQAHYHTSGMGHVYQQRYKSFPIQDDDPFFVVCRYAPAKRVARRTGRASRTVALGIARALASQAPTEPAAVVSLADAPPSRIGRAGQRASIRERIGSGATIGAAGSATGVYVSSAGWNPVFRDWMQGTGMADANEYYQVPTDEEQLDTLPALETDKFPLAL